jgi:hypothetical protein
MTKKRITMNEALRQEEETYQRLKAERKAALQAEARANECSECAIWKAVFDNVIELWYTEQSRASKRLRLAIEGCDFARALRYQIIEETIKRMINVAKQEREKVTMERENEGK